MLGADGQEASFASDPLGYPSQNRFNAALAYRLCGCLDAVRLNEK